MSLRGFLRNWAIGSTAIVGIAIVYPMVAGAGAAPAGTVASEPVPGEAGTETALPPTDSAYTERGRGPFGDLRVTVNQTANLTNQAVSITWTGGLPSTFAGSRFLGNYMQIMQCWGDDDGSVPDNPGPPPEQCVFGASMGAYSPPAQPLNRNATRRLLGLTDWGTYDPAVGHTEGATWWMPFRKVDGVVVTVHENDAYNPANPQGDYWMNPFFNMTTTNEIPVAPTYPDGTGAELMQVLTGVESTGLGCGRQVQPIGDGTFKEPQCWIVLVPRGTPAEENVDTPYEAQGEQEGVQTSPLTPGAWQHRIAIPLEFNPVDSPCALGQTERRIAGNELVVPAVVSWQPVLCAGGQLPPFAYSRIADHSARLQLSNPQAGSPGMFVVADPLDPASVDPQNPVVYSPLAIAGLTIGFNLERQPHWSAPQDELALAGVRVADINLTPRLVAKLLTQSYKGQFNFAGVLPEFTGAYEWLGPNPAHLAEDEDFLRFNPEFRMLTVTDARTFSGLQLPSGNSDAARRLWDWVLADPEARAWLGGQADEWQMTVNPLYQPIVDGAQAPNSFPKSDPYCYQAPSLNGGTLVPPQVCAIEMIPPASGYRDTALRARQAYDGARVSPNAAAFSALEYWQRVAPQRVGARAMLSLTDLASAARYGIQTANLSRAGDNGSDREFVKPGAASLIAAVAAMQPSAEPQVLTLDPAAVPAGAYPLTIIPYAASTPLQLPPDARADYSAFLAHAALDGQRPGEEPGTLPPGYVPLPGALQLQAIGAAALMVGLVPAPPTTTTTTTIPPADTSTTSTPEQPTTTSTTIATATPQPDADPGYVPPLPDDATPATNGQISGGTPSGSPRVSPPAATSSTTTSTSTPISTTILEPAPASTSAPLIGDEPPSAADTPPAVTQLMSLGQSRFAVPGLGVVSLGTALGALEITKRPRRAVAPLEETE